MESLISLVDRIKGHRVYFDTNPFIYFIEENKDFFAVVSPIFELIGTGEIIAYTSELTLTEILIKPIRDKRIDIVQAYTDLLLDQDLISLVQTTQDTFLSAAKIGGLSGLRTPDAIHMAAAIESDCHFFITNDQKIQSCGNVTALYVSDLQP